MSGCMRSTFTSLALLVTASSFTPRRAEACICAETQPRMLIPTHGSSHGSGDPILVGTSLSVTPFLYDPSGKLVHLQLLKQGGPLLPCADQYFLYQPSASTYGTTGDFTLLLASDRSPSVVNRFSSVSYEDNREVTVSVSIQVSRSPIEPFEANSGLCDPPIQDDALIDGFFDYSITLSRAAPVFIEAWYDDPSLGRIQGFTSTVPIAAAPTAAKVSAEAHIDLPHLEGSGDCVELRLYTWKFRTIWSQRVCYAVGEAQSFDVQFGMSKWNLPDAAADAPPYPGEAPSGCAVGPDSSRGASSALYLLGVALLVLVGRCVKIRNAGADAHLASTNMRRVEFVRQLHQSNDTSGVTNRVGR